MFNSVQILSISLIAILVYEIKKLVMPPIGFPRNLPTIPFYVCILCPLLGMDQEEIYRSYLQDKLETYGAVIIYFASRWNVLVTKPEYLQQILRQDNVFMKSGNQKKIPYSVLAEYTGDNVISACGENWKLYRNLVTHAVQFPQLDSIRLNCDKLVQMIHESLKEEREAINISDVIQRYCLANIGDAVIGVDFGTLDHDDGSALHRQVRFTKMHIFKPFFMTFPVLDMLPIPSRLKARRVLRKFKNSYCDKLLNDFRDGSCRNDSAAASLCASLIKLEITRKQFEDNAMILLIAGHENPQLLLTSLMYVISRYRNTQLDIREQINQLGLENAADSAIVHSIVLETIRLFPPLGQIINRRTDRNVILGNDIKISKGTYVGYNNFATQRSYSVWGPDANEFKPERWGNTKEEVLHNFSVAKSKATFPAFHGRNRACLGEKLALYIARVTVVAIVDEFELSLDKHWKFRLTSAGPISPVNPAIIFKSRKI